MPVPKCGRIIKVFHYLRLLIASIARLRSEAPDVVWVQLPQVPALWAALIYRMLSSKRIKVVADCHNAQLRAPWSSFPRALWSLKQCDVVLVHNEAMHVKAAEIGWPMDKVLVLEDVPAVGKERPSSGLAFSYIKTPKPWVLFPGSFATDEPIAEVLEAARIAPEVTFIITGRSERAQQNGHDIFSLPPNVVLPGFLSIEMFDDLLREADVVMGLTKEEGIQLSVCNEALSFGKPLVTSNTRILEKLFGRAAILVDTRAPESIAQGCLRACAEAGERTVKSRQLALDRLMDWKLGKFNVVQRMIRSDASEGCSI